MYSIAHLGGDYIAVGLENALQVVDIGDESEVYIAPARGRIQSIAAAAHWGAKDAPPNIITGSREGLVTRWTLAGGLSQFNEDSYEQIGRRLHALVVNGREVIAASGVELISLDSDMRTLRSAKVPFEVNGMDVVDPNTLIICGEGQMIC